MSGITGPNRYRYQYVPPGSTNVVLGINGGAGDYLHRLVMNVTDPTTCNVILIDGVTSIPISTAGAQNLRGSASIELNIGSRESTFRLTTGIGVSVLAVGQTITHG